MQRTGEAIDHSRAVTRGAHNAPFRPATIRNLDSYIGGCGAAVGTVVRPPEDIPGISTSYPHCIGWSRYRVDRFWPLFIHLCDLC